MRREVCDASAPGAVAQLLCGGVRQARQHVRRLVACPDAAARQALQCDRLPRLQDAGRVGVQVIARAGGILPEQRQRGRAQLIEALLVQEGHAVPHKRHGAAQRGMQTACRWHRCLQRRPHSTQGRVLVHVARQHG